MTIELKSTASDEYFGDLTIEECEKHFEDHYENKVETVGDKDKLPLLRCFIELLNRLEDSPHNYFAGKVLIYLAKVLPLYDQSGLNIKSEQSFKRIPKITQAKEKDKKISQLVEDIEEGETISDEEILDDTDTIFERFWRVQEFLNQPHQLFDKNSWFSFRTNVDAIIHDMEKRPATLDVWKLDKYFMTNPTTFSLQMCDVNMRRCFLVQILIILRYLEQPKQENDVLHSIQISWSVGVTKKIYNLLRVTPNQEEGVKFLGLVHHILKNEELWIKWKNDRCKDPKKEFEDEPVNMRGTYHKRRKISDELSAAESYKINIIGGPEMTKLWNSPKHETQIPDIRQMMDDKKFSDPNHSFKLLRMLRTSPHFFNNSTLGVQNLEGYLKDASDRFAKELKNQQNRNDNASNDS